MPVFYLSLLEPRAPFLSGLSVIKVGFWAFVLIKKQQRETFDMWLSPAGGFPYNYNKSTCFCGKLHSHGAHDARSWTRFQHTLFTLNEQGGDFSVSFSTVYKRMSSIYSCKRLGVKWQSGANPAPGSSSSALFGNMKDLVSSSRTQTPIINVSPWLMFK